MISDVAPIGTVKTVVGENDAWSLGRTNYHEHLFQITPLLPADELDDDRINRATGDHVVATTGVTVKPAMLPALVPGAQFG